MRARVFTATLPAVLLGLFGLAATAWGGSPVLAWKTQLGSSSYDYVYGLAVDSAGNAYITGNTTGSLGGANQGAEDSFLAKYNSAGSLVWKTQLGSSSHDYAYGVTLDSAGNAYITGNTTGNLGGTNQGNADAFLAKYSSTGSLAWKTQLGTTTDESATGVAVDSAGNAYITGWTDGSLGGTNQGNADAFLAKYNSAGSLAWKTQLGTPGFGTSGYDQASGVAVDSAGNAYITGWTTGSLGGINQGDCDAFLVKYSPTGSLLWKTQLGSSHTDCAYGVAVDNGGNAYITGYTTGSLGGTNQGGQDAFLAKYDSAGNLAWETQVGTSGYDEASGVAVDSAGNAYITGFTGGSLGGTNQGSFDAFLTKYDSTGSLAWTIQLGSSGDDRAQGVAVDSAGGIAYITGYTDGSLGGTNQGGDDAFLVKYGVPEPTTLALLALGGLSLIRRRRTPHCFAWEPRRSPA